MINTFLKNCMKDEKGLIYKDLKVVQEDLSTVIMIDDSEVNHRYNKSKSMLYVYMSNSEHLQD